jgi:hypothetical protein
MTENQILSYLNYLTKKNGYNLFIIEDNFCVHNIYVDYKSLI